MSVTVMHFTPEALTDINESFGQEVLHYIPFCRGKTFTGESRWTNVIGFPVGCAVIFINDNNHHSDDLQVLFSLPGGSFYFQKAAHDHEINTCVEAIERAFEVGHSDVYYAENGDVSMVFKGIAPIVRHRILSDHRKHLLSAV